MKLKVIIFLISCATILHNGLANAAVEELKCETEGCYEVIKTFVKLLEEKINETEKILAEAERELNEVTYGNDESFRDKINEINLKLSRLIIDLNTGIDAGDQTLIELINDVFEPLEKAETIFTEIEIEFTDGVRVIKIAEEDFDEVKDVIRKVNEEIRKLENSTTEDLPKAIQDAFDRSEKFTTDSKDIRKVYDKMKIILDDYEVNLVNAKELTLDAMEKFAKIDETLSEAERIEKEVEQIFKIFEGQKLPDFWGYKKLTKNAVDQTASIYDDAFELLNDVTMFDVSSLLDDIKFKINELQNYAVDGDTRIKKFVDDSSKFLDELESKLDKAEVLEKKAIEQQEEIKRKLNEIEDLKKSSEAAIQNKDDTIETARNILNTFENFVIKVEESREMARRAFELMPEILQKIKDAEALVEDLEDKVDRNSIKANKAKEKSFKVRNEIDDVLKKREDIQKEIDKLTDDVNAEFDDMKSLIKEENELSDEIDNLKKSGGEIEDTIDTVRSKAERTKNKIQKVHITLDDSIKNFQDLIAEIEAAKMIDEQTLDEFERKLNEAESELEATQLSQKIKNLKEQREEQNELIKNYKVEMAELEHELALIRENLKSLENKCFRRQQLEP